MTTDTDKTAAIERIRTRLVENLHKSGVPEHMHEHIVQYVMKGTPGGGFLFYIFSNDLVHSAAKADDINQRCLFAYANFLYNYAPLDCWGSAETVARWRSYGGYEGIILRGTRDQVRGEGH